MRKLIFFTMSLVTVLPTLKAQKLKVENVSIGVMFTGAINYSQHHSSSEGNEKLEEKPVKAFYGISPSFNLETNITEHHVMYNLKTNSFQTLHSYKLKHHFDVYVMLEKSLNSKEKYLSFGVEKVIKSPSVKWLGMVFFIEAGTNFAAPSFSGGFFIQPQLFLLRHK